VGQQLCDLAVLLCWQPDQDILEVGVRVMPVKPGALDQAIMMAAARWPARNEPANNQFERLTATEMDLKCFHGKAVPAQALVAARPAQGSTEPHSGIDCSQRYVDVDQAVLE